MLGTLGKERYRNDPIKRKGKSAVGAVGADEEIVGTATG